MTEAQLKRIEAARPLDGVLIENESDLAIATFSSPSRSGATFVVLKDETDATWNAYCAEIKQKRMKNK